MKCWFWSLVSFYKIVSEYFQSLLCMCDTLVVLTDPKFHSLTQVLPELLFGYNQRVCKSLILLQSLREQLHGTNYSFRRVFEDVTLYPIHALQQVLQTAVSYLLPCTFYVAVYHLCSVWQEVGHMVLVSALTVFLLDLSFQQFTWILKEGNNALDVLPKSTLLK